MGSGLGVKLRLGLRLGFGFGFGFGVGLGFGLGFGLGLGIGFGFGFGFGAVSHGRNAKYSEGGGMCGALSQYLVTTTVRPSVSAKLKVEKPVSMPACEIISRSIAIAPSIAACSSAGVRWSYP